MTDILRNDENKVTLDDSVHTDGTRAIKKGPILGDVSNSRSLGAAVQKPLPTYVAAGSSVPKPLNLSSCLFTQNSIDQQDASNPQTVPEYASDIFHNWLKEEEKYCVAPNYMRSQTEINVKMREILVDWLTAVMEKFRLRHETLYLSVNIMDRYLEKVFIPRAKLQLVGITALFLASKYEEVAYPQLADMSHITDDTYSVDQIREMEIAIINKLGFDITVPTLNKFLLRYTKVCKDNQFVTPMANYIAHRSLQEYIMLKYPPSVKAAAAVFLARKYLNIIPYWSILLERFTELSLESIIQCAKEMDVMIHLNSKHDSVRKLYSSSKYLRVATMVPKSIVF